MHRPQVFCCMLQWYNLSFNGNNIIVACNKFLWYTQNENVYTIKKKTYIINNEILLWMTKNIVDV